MPGKLMNLPSPTNLPGKKLYVLHVPYWINRRLPIECKIMKALRLRRDGIMTDYPEQPFSH